MPNLDGVTGWPVRLDPVILYRGDRRTLTWRFFTPPPPWAPGTAYTPGPVGSLAYLPGSTVLRGAARYTCLTGHTAADPFDPALWTPDPVAVGPPVDLTGFGATFLCQLRAQPDTALLVELSLDTARADLGEITAVFTADMWAALAGVTRAGFDVQVDDGAGPPLTLLAGKISVVGDYTHD